MELKDAIQATLEGKAILFAGSGFSFGAKNENNEPIKTGEQLKDYLAELCGTISGNHNLSQVADYYIDQKSEDSLIDLLLKQFRIWKIAQHHETLLSIPWKRIYTTNYDNVIEKASEKNNIELQTITLADNIDNYPKDKVCVHINGSIDRLSRETLKKEFKLTDRSYDSETLRGKPWFDFMERDFMSAQAIIVVGFSMQNDIDITRILAAPKIASKIIFITKPNIDDIDRNAMEKYATTEDIGITKLAEDIKSKAKNFIPSQVDKVYTSFIHEHMKPLQSKPLSLQDITRFYYQGIITDEHFDKDSFGSYKYVLNRNAADCFCQEMTRYKVFVAVASLGNGKTVLCNIIRNELRRIDVDVFTYIADNTDIDDEIASICQTNRRNKSVVIIDDYYKYTDMLKRFSDYGIQNIIFLLTSRVSRTLNFQKLVDILNIKDTDVKPLLINKINENEAKEIAGVFLNNKLLPAKLNANRKEDIVEYLQRQCHGFISSVVLDFFENSYVKQELIDLFKSGVNDDKPEIQELVIASLAAHTMNLGVTFTEILDMLNINYVALKLNDSQIINELFDITGDDLKLKSSIIARYILRNVITSDKLFKVLEKIVIAASKITSVNDKYIEVLKGLVSHSNFIHFISNPEYIKTVLKFYNNIRNISFCQNNPFFWEQFASTCIDGKEYDTAKQCLETAFRIARMLPAFVPYQIETIKARYILEKLKSDLENYVPNAERIVSDIKMASQCLLEHYLYKDNNHYYVFKVWSIGINIINNNIQELNSRSLLIILESVIIVNRKYHEYQKSVESQLYPQTNKWGQEQNDCIAKIKEIINNKDSK